MYIRWKSKPRTTPHIYGYDSDGQWVRQEEQQGILHSAYLATTKRVNGKVKQTCIYLASIQEHQISSTDRRICFWQKCSKKVATLGLTAEQVAMVRAKLREKVPMPTKEAIEAEHAEKAEMNAQLKSLQQRHG